MGVIYRELRGESMAVRRDFDEDRYISGGSPYQSRSLKFVPSK
ncbi:hypothetical protein [Rhizobium leguminosarum]|nr:hypothetical protein U8Q02_43270 [Rhizobium leguminosarum]